MLGLGWELVLAIAKKLSVCSPVQLKHLSHAELKGCVQSTSPAFLLIPAVRLLTLFLPSKIYNHEVELWSNSIVGPKSNQ